MKRWWLSVVVGLTAAVLSACGGGGTEVRIGGGGTGSPLAVGAGTVTGFGSVIVAGEHYDDSQAVVVRDERPDQPTVVTTAAIRLGMQIVVEHRNFVISRATVAAEVIGPVTSIGAATLTVLGQTVLINSDPARPTVFDGFSALGELAGALVEVHGNRAAGGEILATRVERRPNASLLRVAGPVANLSGATFTIGNLTIDASQAALVPAGQSLANGVRVAVWTDLPLANSQLRARVIRVGGFVAAEGTPTVMEGTVADVQSGGRFRLDGTNVDAGSAQFIGGNVTQLVAGRAVRVRGTMMAGVLRAASVQFLQATPAELTGPVTDFTSIDQEFKVRSSAVRVTPQTTYIGGAADHLGDGAVVRVQGPLVNGVVEAQSLTFLPIAAGAQRVQIGTIDGTVTTAADGTKTFRLRDVALDVRTTLTTEYKRGVAADLAAGRQVKVKAELQGTQLVADEVQFMDNAADPVVFELDGVASQVGTNSFKLGGRTLQLTNSTVFLRDGAPGARADLVDGAKVEVSAVRQGAMWVATIVDVQTQAATAATVRGLVSGRTPTTAVEFLVGSQRVSVVGNPQVIPGNKTIADIRNGVDLEVTGTLANGLLTATRIKFR